MKKGSRPVAHKAALLIPQANNHIQKRHFASKKTTHSRAAPRYSLSKKCAFLSGSSLFFLSSINTCLSSPARAALPFSFGIMHILKKFAPRLGKNGSCPGGSANSLGNNEYLKRDFGSEKTTHSRAAPQFPLRKSVDS